MLVNSLQGGGIDVRGAGGGCVRVLVVVIGDVVME